MMTAADQQHRRGRLETQRHALVRTLRGAAAVADLPADLRDAFEERAAIAEFDGGLDRAAAERLAWAKVIREDVP